MQERSLAPRPLTQPAACRLAADSPNASGILAAHAEALERGDAGYIDPESGLFVLTAKFLADRGMCCDKGCRHCPYVL